MSNWWKVSAWNKCKQTIVGAAHFGGLVWCFYCQNWRLCLKSMITLSMKSALYLNRKECFEAFLVHVGLWWWSFRIESYSCKMAGQDKRLYKMLNQDAERAPTDLQALSPPQCYSAHSPSRYTKIAKFEAFHFLSLVAQPLM